MYRSSRRNVLGNQLTRHLAHSDLFGAFDKFSVGYFGPHPRLSQCKPRFHRSRSIGAVCAYLCVIAHGHAHLVSSTDMASAGVSFLDNSAATRMRVPRSGIVVTCDVEADEDSLTITQAASLERLRCADKHGIAGAPLATIRMFVDTCPADHSLQCGVRAKRPEARKVRRSGVCSLS